MIDGPTEAHQTVKHTTNATTKTSHPLYHPHHHLLHHFTHHPEWPLLIDEFELLRSQPLTQLFINNSTRNETFRVHAAGIELDYSLQLMNKEALFLLTELASRGNLSTRIHDLFSGNLVNHTEQRPALHTALRANRHDEIHVNGENIIPVIHHTLSQMEHIANQLRHHTWLGTQGVPITDVVNVGIGGSDLGPKMAVFALKNYGSKRINCHFISDADPDGCDDILDTLNPATTLFIVSSKSFTTTETLLNLKKAMEWLGADHAIKEHIIAVTARVDHAKRFGIHHILPTWDWIGGRYSFFSAINLIVMISIGPEHFYQLLAGAQIMDNHFRSAPFACNMPVLLALLGIWNLNFFCANNHLLLVYSKRLEHFIPYLQQLDMESNGKSMTIHGNTIDYSTGPIVWGGLGNHAEHAFYQLLLQGSHSTPGDCIFIGEERYDTMNQFAFKKLNALTLGFGTPGTGSHPLHRQSGINKIILNKLDPSTLGALVALYEHKIYCQSVLWNINAFDQPGVDAAKRFTHIA